MKMLITSQHPWIFVICVLVTHFRKQCYALFPVRITFCDIPEDSNDEFGRRNYGYPAIPLEFSPPLPAVPKKFEGMAIIANPEDGCRSIAPPPNATDINFTGKWIAAMKSGNCDFAVKIRNAQNASYHMAMIYNEDHKESEYKVKLNCSDTSDIKIFTVNTFFFMRHLLNVSSFYRARTVIVVTNDYGNHAACTNYDRNEYERVQEEKKTVEREKTSNTWFFKILFEFLFPFLTR